MRYGIATCDITPPFRMPMAGYHARKDVFDRASDPLHFTAIVLEENGRRALIGAADLCNWPNDERTENLIQQLSTFLQLAPEQIMLNACHTHGGPKMPGGGYLGCPPNEREIVERYWDWLAQQVSQTAMTANSSLQPGSLHLSEGTTRLPMNRRLLVNGEIINAPNPDGVVNDRLQILLIKDANDRPAAVIMRMACHPVATGPQHLITSDFVGAWRDAIKQAMGQGVEAMFLQGAGGDMRPRPAANGGEWRIMSHDELPAVGRELAAETMAAIAAGQTRPIGPLLLQGHLKTADAQCRPLYTEPQQLQALMNHPRRFEQEYARRCLDLLAGGGSPVTQVPFRVQTLWLDEQTAIVGLNCEPLHAVGAAIEQMFAPRHAIILGYTGGCICYAPDTAELLRGGYEAESYLFETWAGPWATGFENTFRSAVVAKPAQH